MQRQRFKVAVEQLPVEVVAGDVQQRPDLAIGLSHFVFARLAAQVHVRQKARDLCVHRESQNGLFSMVLSPRRDADPGIDNPGHADFVLGRFFSPD